MGRDNQAAVTKSVLHKVTVVSLSLTVYVDAGTHTYPSKISIECKWLQCMSRLVKGTCQILKMYPNVYSTRHNDCNVDLYTTLKPQKEGPPYIQYTETIHSVYRKNV